MVKDDFECTANMWAAFGNLKGEITTTPVLEYSDFSILFVVEVDELRRAIEVVLSEKDANERERPIDCASRGLNDSQRNGLT